MIHEIVPWRTLTRLAIPALKVARRPMVVGEITIPVGATFNPELFPIQIRRERLRQFYEQRLLEPVSAPTDSRQFYLEQLKRTRMQTEELPIAPVTPVASRIVADLPAVEVPVPPEKRKPPKGVR